MKITTFTRMLSNITLEGAKGALTNLYPRIVATDMKLAVRSIASILEWDQPLLGLAVGSVFTIISWYKLPLMLTRFHFDETYRRSYSWEKSLRQ